VTVAGLIETESYSARLRARAIDVVNQRVLITDFRRSQQEEDLTVPPNCGGFGRIRHFHRATSSGWPSNPLPIDPAAKALGLPRTDTIEAQVFQNAACNWRCWYCYVPFDLLSANEQHSAWLSAEDILDLYVAEPVHPLIIDLSGGQPDIVPEWIPWMMGAIRRRGLERSVYLWSDDNLSNDYFHRILSKDHRRTIATYPTYGRVCCFKGYDSESFSFNTQAAPELFSRQFELFDALLTEGLDLYAYVTLTGPQSSTIKRAIPDFVDRLQRIHPNLPLRTVPLEIQNYSPTGPRMGPAHHQAMKNQWIACETWLVELERRFSAAERGLTITDVPLAVAAA
jgi:uncharacterized Fe-S cluster-containing radical SAM superfamily protein